MLAGTVSTTASIMWLYDFDLKLQCPLQYSQTVLPAIAGGSVDIQSVTEASLRVVSCSGAVKLGKIKATSADIDTDGKDWQFPSPSKLVPVLDLSWLLSLRDSLCSDLPVQMP